MLREDLSSKQVRLLRSTYRLIGSKGMKRLTLEDVADDAGVSKAVIVYYFKSKENLVLRTMRWVLAQVADRIQEVTAPAATPEARVRAMIDAIFVDPVRNRNFYLAYTDLVEYAARAERFQELSGEFHTIVEATYADVIRLGVERDTFEARDLEEGAKIVRAIIDGLFVQWLQEPDWRGTHAEYKQTCTRALLSYLRFTPGLG
jgi:TetR/AcrR family fatty acid metabolism transcriptional regulator